VEGVTEAIPELRRGKEGSGIADVAGGGKFTFGVWRRGTQAWRDQTTSHYAAVKLTLG